MYEQRVTVRWKGGTDFESQLPSGATVVMNDSGPKPVETLVGCLGACSGLTLQSILEKMRLPVDGIEIDVEAGLTDKRPRDLVAIRMKYRFNGGNLQADQVERVLTLTDENCSVHLILGKGCPIERSYEIIG